MNDDAATPKEREAAQALAEAGLLTERQASAYVLRDVYGRDRPTAAVAMDCTVNVVDKHLRAARDKLDDARDTLAVLHALDAPTPALARLDGADE